MQDQLIIFDTTMRDGEQSPGAAMTKDDKVRIGKQLERLRVDVIEAGFAASSPGDFEAIRAVAAAVKDSTVCSLARANDNDVKRAGEAVKGANSGRSSLLATSPTTCAQLRMQPDQVVESAGAGEAGAAYTESRVSPRTRCSEVDFPAQPRCASPRVRQPSTFPTLRHSARAGAACQDSPEPPSMGQGVWSPIAPTTFVMALATRSRRDGARPGQCTINGLGERAGNASLGSVMA